MLLLTRSELVLQEDAWHGQLQVALLDMDEGEEAEVEEDVDGGHPRHARHQPRVGVGGVAPLRGGAAEAAPHAPRLRPVRSDDLVHSLHQALVRDLDQTCERCLKCGDFV